MTGQLQEDEQDQVVMGGLSNGNGVAPLVPSWPSWSVGNAKMGLDQKQGISRFFAHHYFLVQERDNPEADRLHEATVLVIPGTSPNNGVDASLRWMQENWKSHGPFNVTWFTPAALAAQTIRDFREEHQYLRTAAKLYLFPGQVDPDVEAVIGEVPVNFASMHLGTRFTYSFLSAYTFDLRHGFAYFYYIDEVGLQRACAALPAAHKFLFLPQAKFAKVEGQRAYGIRDLFATSNSVTIMTVSSATDDTIKEDFNSLCEDLKLSDTARDDVGRHMKELTLCIVNTDAINAETITRRGRVIANEQ